MIFVFAWSLVYCISYFLFISFSFRSYNSGLFFDSICPVFLVGVIFLPGLLKLVLTRSVEERAETRNEWPEVSGIVSG